MFRFATLILLCGCTPRLLVPTLDEPRMNGQNAAMLVGISSLLCTSAEGICPQNLKPLLHSTAHMLAQANSGLNVHESTIPTGLNLTIELYPAFTQRMVWPWYLGMGILGPLWPALPRQGVLEIVLRVSLQRDGRILERMEFIEQESFDLFWYGAWRQGILEKQLQFMYHKLIVRLRDHMNAGIGLRLQGEEYQ